MVTASDEGHHLRHPVWGSLHSDAARNVLQVSATSLPTSQAEQYAVVTLFSPSYSVERLDTLHFREIRSQALLPRGTRVPRVAERAYSPMYPSHESSPLTRSIVSGFRIRVSLSQLCSAHVGTRARHRQVLYKVTTNLSALFSQRPSCRGSLRGLQDV